MYWKTETYTDEDGNEWLIYNYYAVITISTNTKPYYNGFLKEFVYPQTKQLVIRAAISESEEAFQEWYESNKSI